MEPRRARGRPRADDVQELEKRLVRVARQCFLAKGYGATSMNEIAKAARVSKGTLYARFQTKADLFRAIIDAQIKSRGGPWKFSDPQPKTIAEMLRAYARLSFEASLKEEILQLNRLIYSEAGRFPELGEAAWQRSRVGVQEVAQFISDYAAREGISCSDPEAVADTFTTMLRGLYGDQMLRGRVIDQEEIIASANRMIEVLLADKHNW